MMIDRLEILENSCMLLHWCLHILKCVLRDWQSTNGTKAFIPASLFCFYWCPLIYNTTSFLHPPMESIVNLQIISWSSLTYSFLLLKSKAWELIIPSQSQPQKHHPCLCQTSYCTCQSSFLLCFPRSDERLPNYRWLPGLLFLGLILSCDMTHQLGFVFLHSTLG